MVVTSTIDQLINPVVSDPHQKQPGFLEKEDFLKLLVTQLRYQNPLEPIENQDFGAQLAQFSSLEQLTNLNETMQQTQQTNLQLTQAISNTMSASLVGKRILAQNNRFFHVSPEQDIIRFGIVKPAQTVHVRILTPVGTVLYEEDLGAMPKGEHTFVWNGVDSNGNLVSDGQYLFEVIAEGSDGENVAGAAKTSGVISSVRFRNGVAYVVVNNVEIPISDVSEILGELE